MYARMMIAGRAWLRCELSGYPLIGNLSRKIARMPKMTCPHEKRQAGGERRLAIYDNI